MRWPLVSARAFDLAVDERDRLRAQNELLLDQIVRMQRVQQGMSELPREQRPAPEPMPRELADYVGGFRNPSIRQQTRRDYYRRNGRGESWEKIIAGIPALRPPPEEDGP